VTGRDTETHDAVTTSRPATLEDVAARTRDGGPFDPLLREFLDEFYVGTTEKMANAIAREPAQIGIVPDAYLAAVAEHLALKYRLVVPAWVEGPSRFLTEPFFSGGLESLKAILLVESPLAFRRRQIFVSANALSRPRERAATVAS
jgi:hypothetical protein